MARKREEWISASEAAVILTNNTDHEISPDYVRMLARLGKIDYRERNERENEYLASDVKKYTVRRKHAPRVRPRPSTRKSDKPREAIA